MRGYFLVPLAPAGRDGMYGKEPISGTARLKGDSFSDPPGSRGSGGNRGVGRGDMRVWQCRGRPRSSRRPYGKEGVSNDHRWPAAVTTGDRRVGGPVLTFGREKELRIGLTGGHSPVPARLRNWLNKPEVYYGLLDINYQIGCKCDYIYPGL